MNSKKKNTGSTMVEVLVGFTLLMLLMAGLTRLIKLSSEMVFKTRDTMNIENSFEEEYYKSDHGALSTDKVSSGDILLVETDSDGNDKSDGVSLELYNTNIEKISSEELSVYRIYRETEEP